MQGTSSGQGLGLRQTWSRVSSRLFAPRCGHARCKSRRITALWTAHPPLCFQGTWFCSPSCAEQAIRAAIDRLVFTSPRRPARRQHRLPLGLLMLSRGDLSDRQLQAALDAQQGGQPRKIGEWLQLLQFATERQVLTGLSVQWTLPLLSSPEAALPAPARLLPAVLRRELRLVPVRFVEATNELYLATSQRVEHTLLNAIGSILGCGILPCLVSETVMSGWIENASPQDEDLAQQFDRITNPAEIVRIASSYAARLHCEDFRIARCGSYLWVWLGHRTEKSHLLFRLAESSAEAASASLDLHAAV